MKLKNHKTKKPILDDELLENFFLNDCGEKVKGPKLDALNYKRSLKIIFRFFRANKKMLIINPPKLFKSAIKFKKNVTYYDSMVLQELNITVKTVSQHNIVVLFSIEPESYYPRGEEIPILTLSEPFLSTRLLKEISVPKKPVVLVGEKIPVLQNDYTIKLIEKHATDESYFLGKFLRTIF